MQRDRNYASYEDTEARYEMRPSAWVTPIGDWGARAGSSCCSFRFRMRPTTTWWPTGCPEKMPAAGESLDIAYQVSWQGAKPAASAQRLGHAIAPRQRLHPSQPGRIHSDRPGDRSSPSISAVPALDNLPDDAPGSRPSQRPTPTAGCVESLAYKNPATGHWRMTLRVAARWTLRNPQSRSSCAPFCN